jgi:hypothetical protein
MEDTTEDTMMKHSENMGNLGENVGLMIILKVGGRQLHSRKPEAGNCLEIAKLTKFRSHCTAGVLQKCSVLSVLS